MRFTPFAFSMLPLALAALCAAAGALTDLRSRRIPNRLTGPALLVGFAVQGYFTGVHGLLLSAAAAAVCGGVFTVFYIAGGMGAGDVKLMAAVGALAGWDHVAFLLALTALCGGAMGVGLAVLRGRLRETLANVGALLEHHRTAGLQPHPDLHVRNDSMLRLPYGVAIAAGTCATLYLQMQAR